MVTSAEAQSAKEIDFIIFVINYHNTIEDTTHHINISKTAPVHNRT